VVYEARPVGSAATIVWLDYLNYGVEIDKTTAYILVSAILADTDALYKTLHAEKLSYEGMTNVEIFFSDYKEYEASGVKFGIGLMNALDEDAAAALAERMKEAMTECFDAQGVDLMYASVGMRENGEKIDRTVPTNEASGIMIEEVFTNYDEYDGASFIFREGLGRKSKFVPGLTDYLAAHKSEE